MAVIVKSILGGAINLDTVVIGSIMPLVPGVAITNAVRDTLQGDYISGCARILEAFLRRRRSRSGSELHLRYLEMESWEETYD